MNTLFVLFNTYDDLHEAVKMLIDAGFKESEMNLIISQSEAKLHTKIGSPTQGTDKTSRVGEQRLFGSERLLAGEQPVQLPDAGPVYAAGDMATILVKDVKSATGTIRTGLAGALRGLNVSADDAHSYIQGILDGKALFWIRTEELQVPKAGYILNRNKGKMLRIRENAPTV